MVVGHSVFASLGDRSQDFHQTVKESVMEGGVSSPGLQARVAYAM